MTPIAYVTHDDFLLHEHFAGHPESPGRLRAVQNAISKNANGITLLPVPPRPATREELELVHTPGYIDEVETVCQTGGGLLDGQETGVGTQSCEVARLACGAVMNAIDAVCSGTAGRAFCAARPPGHHALPDAAMGFCIFNSVAVGARWAHRTHGIDRILIIDIDYHHGNGTQEVFWQDGDVAYFSVHCSPAWPLTGAVEDTGEGAGAGTTANAPLPPGARLADYEAKFKQVLQPLVQRHKPEFILMSTGFDTHENDTLVPDPMALKTRDFYVLTRKIVEWTNEYAGHSRIVSVLEGGYNPAETAKSVLAHLEGLSI